MQLRQKISCIDVSISGNVSSKGVAHKEPHETYEQFLKVVSENEKIIGFEWDGETLGIILG